jgi:hypothetical protein
MDLGDGDKCDARGEEQGRQILVIGMYPKRKTRKIIRVVQPKTVTNRIKESISVKSHQTMPR